MRGKAVNDTEITACFGITPAYAGKSLSGLSVRLLYRDHPRLCGEKLPIAAMYHNSYGSPPPMRGKAGDMRVPVLPGRITPAYAGKREVPKGCVEHGGDHPRLCGEKPLLLLLERFQVGSPPPMRGKENACVTDAGNIGITPAYAGKSLAVGVLWIHNKDHPRLCGEKIFSLFSHAPQTGSPPPMRGKVVHKPLAFFNGRITPAYAGKSYRPDTTGYVTRDHPRLCGEKVMLFLVLAGYIGSPPPMRGKAKEQPVEQVKIKDHPRLCGEKPIRQKTVLRRKGSPPPMRGKDITQIFFNSGKRITPAYAGKSGTIVPANDSTAGSPPPMRGKVRPPAFPKKKARITPAYAGKSFLLFSFEQFRIGSPPPMRGKVPQQQQDIFRWRITPAYAGKSQPATTGKRRHRDHPRLCGEKVLHVVQNFFVPGSPPPMRGKGYQRHVCGKITRITPAYAGKRQTSTELQPII